MDNPMRQQQVRPNQNQSGNDAGQQSPVVSTNSTAGGPKRFFATGKGKLAVLAVAVVIVVLGLFAAGVLNKGSESGNNNLISQVKQDQYQAVFLSNGQVYFGKISSFDQNTMILEDIYYLQVDQQLQPEQEGFNNEEPQISLAKLGGELHGPEDEMFINVNEVVFWENLRADGQVSQAIAEHKQTGGGLPQDPPTEGQQELPEQDGFEQNENVENNEQ